MYPAFIIVNARKIKKKNEKARFGLFIPTPLRLQVPSKIVWIQTVGDLET